MKKQTFLSKSIFLIVLSLVCTHQPAYAKKMYKWVDENGKVFFSDKIPPTETHYKRESLDKNARVIDVVSKAKTKAQHAMDKRLQELRRQQEKLVAAQKLQDKSLLSAFRTLKDMKHSQQAKLKTLDNQKKDLEKKLISLKEELASFRDEAVQADRNNKEMSKEVSKGIEETEKKIKKTELNIEAHIEKKKKTEKKFATDRTRYSFLASPKTENSIQKSENINKSKTAINQLGLFFCENDTQCDKAWRIARQFVEKNSTRRISLETNEIIMTEDPISTTDLSLSVSKMVLESKNIQIFLDIRCRETIKGDGLCTNNKAENLRLGFSDFIKSKLGLETDKEKQQKAEAAKKVKAAEKK